MNRRERHQSLYCSPAHYPPPPLLPHWSVTGAVGVVHGQPRRAIDWARPRVVCPCLAPTAAMLLGHVPRDVTRVSHWLWAWPENITYSATFRHCTPPVHKKFRGAKRGGKKGREIERLLSTSSQSSCTPTHTVHGSKHAQNTLLDRCTEEIVVNCSLHNGYILTRLFIHLDSCRFLRCGIMF